MIEQNETITPYALIPLSSDEPIWEWDLVSDSVFFSIGARKHLRLDPVPAKMTDFYKLLHPEAASQLIAYRKEIITGKAGSALQCNYLLNGLWAHEQLLVLSRNSKGMATRIIGRLSATPILRPNVIFRTVSNSHYESGIWIFDVANAILYRDRICNELLGLDNSPAANIDFLLKNIHPEDLPGLIRHLELFLSGPYIGDHISDIIRVKDYEGEYLSIILRTVAMKRDQAGKPVLLAGMVIQNENQECVDSALLKDDRLFRALDNLGSGQWNWDTKNDIMYFCKRYLAIMGYDEENGKQFSENWREHIHPDDLSKVVQTQLAVVSGNENGDRYECTYRMRRADDTWAWIFDRGYVTWRENDGSAGHMLGSIINITTAQAGRDRLEELVRHDSLTGLRSRAYCKLELEHIEQNKIRPVTIISIDITGLKMINDTLGHAMGDELLTKSATLLQNSLRASDCIARMGGDEFMVVLPNCNAQKGQKLLKKIRDNFEAYNSSGNLPVFAALGMAAAINLEESIESVIAAADKNMYADKDRQRTEAHAAIKEWIFKHTGKSVQKDDRLG